MSKRVTQSKKSKRSARSTKYELVSRRDGVGRRGQAKVLAEAIDNDPFEIIGIASTATSGMQSKVGELFDEFANEDPRLGPTLWATVAMLPFIDGFARSEPILRELLPAWLLRLDEARITGVMRRSENRKQDRSTYLVEVTMVPDVVTTCVFELRHGRRDEIVGFWTVAAPIGDVVTLCQEKHRRTCDHAYAPVAFAEACQNLVIAFDGSLYSKFKANLTRPPWPLNMPTAGLVINIAMRQIQPADVTPYVTLRRNTSGASPAAKALRRSLKTWPTI